MVPLADNVGKNQGQSMSRPILSICIPTYNRGDLLGNTLSCITSDPLFKDTNDIQIVISDNCSTDSTEQVCQKYVRDFPQKIKYIRQEKTIFAPYNIYGVLDYADGKFLKMHNDNMLFVNDGLHKLIDIVKQDNADVIFCLNEGGDGGKIKYYDNINAIVDEISYMTTWMCAHCYRAEIYKKLEYVEEYMLQWVSSVDVLFRMVEGGARFACLYGHMFQGQTVNKKGGQYNIAEVFGRNYVGLLRKYVDKKQLSLPVFTREKKKILLKLINPFYFDIYSQYTFQKTGYLRYLYNDYWDKPYFYMAYGAMLIKKAISLFVVVTKDSTYKHIKIFRSFDIRVKRRKCRR